MPVRFGVFSKHVYPVPNCSEGIRPSRCIISFLIDARLSDRLQTLQQLLLQADFLSLVPRYVP
jgi:hypothetical protein